MGANHARVIAESEGADLAVIIDTDPERVRPLADRLGCAFAEDLDAAADCDAAVIATPTAFHAGAARALIELGKPILVEKPVTPDLSHQQGAGRLLGTPRRAADVRFRRAIQPGRGDHARACSMRSRCTSSDSGTPRRHLAAR